ncbi:hypothetical protein EYF80_032087 [Liparis tanakae]|uniref:Uncharacterized protein n=1 Tax=Liparis tanakae TaxID=230148 RepID=A0A4Z2GW83_9TELE|nr:hypothetical protein EYF80_032087 [Liparis tanakae]
MSAHLSVNATGIIINNGPLQQQQSSDSSQENEDTRSTAYILRHRLTSLPFTMRWCVVIRALNTTTQLALPTLSISVSAIRGTFTVVSWVACSRSEEHRGEERQKVRWWIPAGGETRRWDGVR